MAARFPELSENELSCLLQEKTSENAKKLLKRVFRQYLQARKINEDDVIR